MKTDKDDIQTFLTKLRDALHGQPEGLIQDALYDAQSHLQDAAGDEENADLTEIIKNYGRPEDIAAQYIQMEQDLLIFMNGPTSERPRFNGFFEPLVCLRDYKALGYFFIAFPLSIVYFAWLALVGLPSLVLSVFIVGLPVLITFLNAQRYLGLFEGQLINGLLGFRMPRRPARGSLIKTRFVERVWGILCASHGWKICLYTALQVPLSITYFFLTCVLFAGSLGLIATPLVDPVIHFFMPHLEVDIPLYWLPVTSIVGAVGMTLSLHISRALVRLHTGIAASLLVAK